MAKKAKKKTKKRRPIPTEWAIGQSLTFPKKKPKLDDVQNALDIVKHAIGEPLVSTKKTRES